MKKTFHSNGKLLLTGEYLVLDGASALAIPTKYGQSLRIQSSNKEGMHWKSFDEKGFVWFEESFDLNDFNTANTENKYSKTLTKILREAQKLNPDFLSSTKGMEVHTKLDFPRKWGLGTSSTLINNIAQWSKVDAYTLLRKSFGGSGYDVAAAQHNLPILYQLKNDNPQFKEVMLNWDFKEFLHFVYLNKKQDSKQGIVHYRKTKVSKSTIEQISNISNQLTQCQSLSDFETLLNLHEQIISKAVNLPTLQTQLFHDYPHTIKSLGAWGGDFILATGTPLEMEYFKNKGFKTIIPFTEMIL